MRSMIISIKTQNIHVCYLIFELFWVLIAYIFKLFRVWCTSFELFQVLLKIFMFLIQFSKIDLTKKNSKYFWVSSFGFGSKTRIGLHLSKIRAMKFPPWQDNLVSFQIGRVWRLFNTMCLGVTAESQYQKVLGSIPVREYIFAFTIC